MRPPKAPQRRTTRTRAATPETRAQVRQAFIDVGRHLFATQDGGKVSLRQIAAAAGYSPGTIYQYFQDHQALQVAIRARDMSEATTLFEKSIAGIQDPVERVRKLFRLTVRHWMAHLDAFDQLFGRGPPLVPLMTDEGVPYGQSSTAQRALAVYYEAVDAMFATFAKPPLPARLAADVLIGTVHGLISFPRHTRTMEWSDSRKMADAAIDALLASWTAQAEAHPTPKSRKDKL